VKAERGWMNREHKEILTVHNRTQTAKGISIRNLCQEDQGNAETKWKPVTVRDRTTYSTVTECPICENCLKKDESTTHILWL
jgi:hypothetical protein